jgi:hypothetical protein
MAARFPNMLPPIPVDAETIREIKALAKKTRLSQTDVVRQSLRLGLPRLETTALASVQKRRPKCFDCLDEYPASEVAAGGINRRLKSLIAKKNELHR